MKKIIQDIKSGFTIGIVFILTILFSGIVYATISHVTDGDSLTAAKWNELVDGVNNSLIPSGLVSAFNLSNCPIGWSIADGSAGRPDLRGQFIRGLDNGRGLDPDSSRALGSTQDATYIGFMAGYGGDIFLGNDDGIFQSKSRSKYENNNNVSYLGNDKKVRPTNVALLYCIKN